jgi:protoporphyrinogen IX oxidase
MWFAYLKALHIIFVVTWFAGLFYLVRLFIYHREAQEQSPEARDILSAQYSLMEQRLWSIITAPSMWLTVGTGFYLLHEMRAWDQPWMLVKLAFVGGLVAYHLACRRIMHQMQRGDFRQSSHRLRLWNEVATLLLFAIVFMVVLKSAVTWIWGLLALVGLSLALMVGVKIYRRIRERSVKMGIRNSKFVIRN